MGKNDGVATSWTELLGFVTGIAAVWLAAQRSLWNWPVGIGNSVFFGVVFLDARLFADAALQVIYLALGVFGWWTWIRLGRASSTRDIGRASRTTLALTSIGVVAAALVLEPILRSAGDSAPMLDAVTTALSLGAQTLLSLKYLENWWLWIAADVIYVPLYASRELYLTAAVYVVFLVICVRALPSWRAASALQPAPAT